MADVPDCGNVLVVLELAEGMGMLTDVGGSMLVAVSTMLRTPSKSTRSEVMLSTYLRS